MKIPAGWWLCALLVTLTRGGAATLEELIAEPRAWPVELAITSPARATVLEKGQPKGAMLLGTGRTITVTAIAADGVTGKVGGMVVRVPVEKTDLLSRVAGLVVAPPAPPPVADGATAAAPEAATSGVAAPATKPAVGAAPSIMQRRLTGKLVRLQGSSLKPVDAASLGGVKYYALYYSASWCGPCKQFTPELVRDYQQLKAQYPQFEVVFISGDHNAGAMRDYMREDRMAWPALNYEARSGAAELMRYGGPGIPCLVLVDDQGAVLSDSFENGNYVGPRKVLADAKRILQRGR